MTAAERRLIVNELADEIVKRTDKVINMEEIKKIFDVKTDEAIYEKKKKGLPLRRKKK